MANPWLVHLKSVRKANPNLSMKQCMKAAKKTYTKIGGPKASKKSRKVRKSRKVIKSRKVRKSKKSRKSRKSRKH